MGSKSSSSSSTTKTDMNQQGYESSTRTPFTSADMKRRYGNFANSAENNYKDLTDLSNYLNARYSSGQGIGDDSYFKQAWGQAQGIDQNNIKKINSGSIDPLKNQNYMKAMKDIFANGKYTMGDTINKINQQSGISNNMGGSTGHQSALYNAAQRYASQQAADMGNMYLQQYNQNVQNTLAANGQLENFYSTLSNIGLDYAKLSQQDLSTLLSAYNAQNDALKTWGNAVEMGSDPTVTTENRQKQWGTQHTNSESKQSEGFGGIFGTVADVMPWGKMFS